MSRSRLQKEHVAQKGERAMKLVYDQSKCSGCAVCTSVCSFRQKGLVHPANGRIKFVYVSPTDSYVVLCHQCEDAACAKACPQKAIMRYEKTGAWRVDVENCIGCGLCVEACSYGAIYLDKDTGKADKCDLCQGDPACVKYCLAEALKLEEE